MSAADDLKRVKEIVVMLNPSRVAAEVRYVRAGARSADLGRIGHSAERPLPLPDRDDRSSKKVHREYQKNLAAMRKLAERNKDIELILLTRLHGAGGAPTEEAKRLAEDGKGRSCENCGIVVHKLLNHRCRACHEYLKRKGVDRPSELIEREVYGGGA